MARAKKSDSARERQNVQKTLEAAKRAKAIQGARTSLLGFTRLTMPHPEDPDNLSMSLYEDAKHHRALCAALEEVEKGHILRLIITMPPRHGKSELASRRFIPWVSGLDPYRQVIFATYSETFAEDFGRDVKAIVNHPAYKQIFPGYGTTNATAGRIKTTAGGLLVFVGRGGAVTGRGGDFLLLDDPFKDAEEAESPTIREKAWEWFVKVFLTRQMAGARVVVTLTRWHEDDIVGRLTDPRNPHYDPEEAAKWKIINLPAIAEDDDPIGREPGQALWPERFDLEFLEAQRRIHPRAFSALYQQKPTPDDGDFFRRQWIYDYDRDELPNRLTIFAASDHAVGLDKTMNDETVMIVVGVDDKGIIWILDAWHGRESADHTVERMIDLMKEYKPIFWWAEKGHITQSLGPFLRRRMRERNVYCAIEEVAPLKNKIQRAQSIQGRMAMRMVRFPKHKLFYTELVDQLMKFPLGRHDDFVDALAWVGMKLERQFGPGMDFIDPASQIPKTGTLAWIKWQEKNVEELTKFNVPEMDQFEGF